ncbi:MAG TPA: ABC transporter ATP-binding protein, partial [Acidimicrobiia bacterium]
MGTPARVVARGLGVRHPSRQAWAVTGVDLVVEPGERVLLTGASGAGKSTLLAALAGILDAEGAEVTGELTVDGGDPQAARGRLGLLAQDPDSQLVMTRAGDDVAFGLENAGLPAAEIWPRVDEALAAVGFPHGRDRPTQALSGGEKQRLVLAGVLARRPGLLLLDEPTAQLDPPGAALVRSAVARVTADRSATTIIVDHD